MPEQGNRMPLIVGFALDVSGSMRSSLENPEAGELARLDGIRRAIDTVLEEAQRLTEADNSDLSAGDVRFFAYAYGLRIPDGIEVGDLFRLLEVQNDLKKENEPEIRRYAEELKNQFERRLNVNPRSVAIEVMGSSAMRLLGMPESEAKKILRVEIEEHIRWKVTQRFGLDREIANRLNKDVTLTTQDIRKKWNNFREGIGTANEYLGGSTPMREAFKLVGERFKRELNNLPNAKLMLFVVSDGGSTDGDPRHWGEEIKKLGVTVISCFISSDDLLSVKRLVKAPPEARSFGILEKTERPWDEGALVMFDVASTIFSESDEEKYLKARGWDVPDGARLFSQINHSQMLNEFIQVVLTPIDLEHSLAKKKEQ